MMYFVIYCNQPGEHLRLSLIYSSSFQLFCDQIMITVMIRFLFASERRGRERENLPYTDPLPKFCNSQSQARLKPEAQNPHGSLTCIAFDSSFTASQSALAGAGRLAREAILLVSFLHLYQHVSSSEQRMGAEDLQTFRVEASSICNCHCLQHSDIHRSKFLE